MNEHMSLRLIKPRGQAPCWQCKSELKRNETYDSYFCEYCDEWREASCNDKTCEFCSKRPKRPSAMP